MLKRILVGLSAVTLLYIMTLGTISASPGSQEGARAVSFNFLITVLADAGDKGALSDEISELLSDLFTEYLVIPHTGEIPEQARNRLSSEGQSAFQLLIAVLTDADDKGALSDEINELLSDLFIEYLIAPHTGETPELARNRLSTQALIAADRAALVALYDSTGGPNWKNNTSWLSDSPLAEWHGVTVDGDGRVTQLILNGNQMSGEIPPELGNPTKLQILLLSTNQLRGPIPAELGSLANLEVLYLGGNELSGSIPPELGNLTKLKDLYIGRNQLTGCIPNVLGDTLENDFSKLGLSFCDPRASNPSDKTILEAFYNATGGGEWSDPTNWLSDEPISLWHGVATDSNGRVTALTLRYNQLSGSIPPQLDDLSRLRSLNFARNQLSGSIPPRLGNLSNLEYIFFYGNQLSGSIPPQLGNLSNLTALRLDGNQLIGTIPSELSDLTNLELLYLKGNSLTGCIPTALWSVPSNDLDLLDMPLCAQ